MQAQSIYHTQYTVAYFLCLSLSLSLSLCTTRSTTSSSFSSSSRRFSFTFPFLGNCRRRFHYVHSDDRNLFRRRSRGRREGDLASHVKSTDILSFTFCATKGGICDLTDIRPRASWTQKKSFLLLLLHSSFMCREQRRPIVPKLVGPPALLPLQPLLAEIHLCAAQRRGERTGGRGADNNSSD